MYISEDEPKNSSDKLDKILQETKEKPKLKTKAITK